MILIDLQVANLQFKLLVAFYADVNVLPQIYQMLIMSLVYLCSAVIAELLARSACLCIAFLDCCKMELCLWAFVSLDLLLLVRPSCAFVLLAP